VQNNLLDAVAQPRDGAAVTLADNVSNAQTTWFASPQNGDLHLTASATAAIGHATALADAPDDFDAQSRPVGVDKSDIGADQTFADEIFANGFGG